jgi:tRNA(Ile2) C34 agmatinyltransferase TiaS
MGLGPPVCIDCGVIASLSEGRGWRCQSCGDTSLPKHLWMFPKDEQDEFELNTVIAKENRGLVILDK